MRRTQPPSTENPEPSSFLQASTAAGYVPEQDLAEYIEQFRATLESQRLSFDNERAAFAEERRLWEKERAMMQERLADLERRLGSACLKDGQLLHPRTALSNPSDSTPKPTRVYPSKRGSSDINPVDYGGYYPRSATPPDDAPSARSQLFDRRTFTKTPVAHVGSTADGITPEYTGPLHERADRSPPFSRDTSGMQPTAEPTEAPTRGNGNGDAAEHKLIPVTTADLGPVSQTIHPEMLAEEPPLAPQHTHDELETHDSHSPRLDEDPALQGPLTLQNDKDLDYDFLHEVDQKLSVEARRLVPASSTSESGVSNDDLHDEPEPELRFKQSTNFGTAFGSSRCRIP